MRQNARYKPFYAKQLDERIEEFVMCEELIMLIAAELTALSISQRKPG